MLVNQMYTFSKYSKHFHEAHGGSDLLNESHFKIPRKFQCKFDCLLFDHEKLHIKNEIQTDSVRANGLSTRAKLL